MPDEPAMQAGDRPALKIIKRSSDRPMPGHVGERRFPPVVQVLTLTAPHIQQRLQDLAMVGFRNGNTTEEICSELHTYACSFGYDVTIGVLEVRTDEMPSFRGSVVCSTIMLVDLKAPRQVADPAAFLSDYLS